MESVMANSSNSHRRRQLSGPQPPSHTTDKHMLPPLCGSETLLSDCMPQLYTLDINTVPTADLSAPFDGPPMSALGSLLKGEKHPALQLPASGHTATTTTDWQGAAAGTSDGASSSSSSPPLMPGGEENTPAPLPPSASCSSMVTADNSDFNILHLDEKFDIGKIPLFLDDDMSLLDSLDNGLLQDSSPTMGLDLNLNTGLFETLGPPVDASLPLGDDPLATISYITMETTETQKPQAYIAYKGKGQNASSEGSSDSAEAPAPASVPAPKAQQVSLLRPLDIMIAESQETSNESPEVRKLLKAKHPRTQLVVAAAEPRTIPPQQQQPVASKKISMNSKPTSRQNTKPTAPPNNKPKLPPKPTVPTNKPKLPVSNKPKVSPKPSKSTLSINTGTHHPPATKLSVKPNTVTHTPSGRQATVKVNTVPHPLSAGQSAVKNTVPHPLSAWQSAVKNTVPHPLSAGQSAVKNTVPHPLSAGQATVKPNKVIQSLAARQSAVKIVTGSQHRARSLPNQLKPVSTPSVSQDIVLSYNAQTAVVVRDETQPQISVETISPADSRSSSPGASECSLVPLVSSGNESSSSSLNLECSRKKKISLTAYKSRRGINESNGIVALDHSYYKTSADKLPQDPSKPQSDPNKPPPVPSKPPSVPLDPQSVLIKRPSTLECTPGLPPLQFPPPRSQTSPVDSSSSISPTVSVASSTCSSSAPSSSASSSSAPSSSACSSSASSSSAPSSSASSPSTSALQSMLLDEGLEKEVKEQSRIDREKTMRNMRTIAEKQQSRDLCSYSDVDTQLVDMELDSDCEQDQQQSHSSSSDGSHRHRSSSSSSQHRHHHSNQQQHKSHHQHHPSQRHHQEHHRPHHHQRPVHPNSSRPRSESAKDAQSRPQQHHHQPSHHQHRQQEKAERLAKQQRHQRAAMLSSRSIHPEQLSNPAKLGEIGQITKARGKDQVRKETGQIPKAGKEEQVRKETPPPPPRIVPMEAPSDLPDPRTRAKKQPGDAPGPVELQKVAEGVKEAHRLLKTKLQLKLEGSARAKALARVTVDEKKQAEATQKLFDVSPENETSSEVNQVTQSASETVPQPVSDLPMIDLSPVVVEVINNTSSLSSIEPVSNAVEFNPSSSEAESETASQKSVPVSESATGVEESAADVTVEAVTDDVNVENVELICAVENVEQSCRVETTTEMPEMREKEEHEQEETECEKPQTEVADEQKEATGGEESMQLESEECKKSEEDRQPTGRGRKRKNNKYQDSPPSKKKRNYRKRPKNEEPEEEGLVMNKLPPYFTALATKSLVSQATKPSYNVIDSSLPYHDRDPSPDRSDPTYNKVPEYFSTFTNSTKYDNIEPVYDIDLGKNVEDDDDIWNDAVTGGKHQSSKPIPSTAPGSACTSRSHSPNLLIVSQQTSRAPSPREPTPSPPGSPHRSRSRGQSNDDDRSRSRSSYRGRRRQRKRYHRYSYSGDSDKSSDSEYSRSRSPVARRRRSSSGRRNTPVRSSYSRSPARANSRHRSGSSRRRSNSRRRYSRSRSRSLSRGRERDRARRSERVRRRRSYSPDDHYKTEEDRKRERDVKKATEDRRIVYVGRIPVGFTRRDLREKFARFGAISETSVHFRDVGENYGFVTFYECDDAYKAFENGKKVEGCETFQLSFGGRRGYCASKYEDYDGNKQDEEEMGMSRPTGQVSKGDFDFDALLRQHQSAQK